MINLWNKIKSFFNKLYRTHNYIGVELQPALAFINEKEVDMLSKRIEFEKKQRVYVDRFNEVKSDVMKRYFSNIRRAFLGKELHQDEEARFGISYHNLGSVDSKRKRFVVKDNAKFEDAHKQLETLVNEPYVSPQASSVGVSKPYNVSNSGVFAKYVDSFRADCFTNKLAVISSSYSGSVKAVADTLAGFVHDESGSLVSPHKRSWDSRVSALEDLIISNNFGSEDLATLEDVKSALASNKYLVTKKRAVYEKAVLLLDKALERKAYEGA